VTTPNSGFREPDHPRVSKGSSRGGQFTTKDAWRQVGQTAGLALATGAGATATGATATTARAIAAASRSSRASSTWRSSWSSVMAGGGTSV
jgi:hypothetical protein